MLHVKMYDPRWTSAVIKTSVFFSDNSRITITDRLLKVRPLLDELVEKFLQLYAGISYS